MRSGLVKLDQPSSFARWPDGAARRVFVLRRRLASAASRRFKAWWNRWAEGDRPPAAEAAVHWLTNCASLGGASRPGLPPCLGTSAAFLPTLLTFGQLDLAGRWCSWLLSTQLADGSFPHGTDGTGSRFNTAQALAALVAGIDGGFIRDPTSAIRAAEYLDARLRAELLNSAVATESKRHSRAQTAVLLTLLPALSEAARHFGVPEWRQTVERSTARLRAAIDWNSWSGSSRVLAHAVNVLIDLEERDLAIEALALPNAAQMKDGAVAGDLRGSWGDHELLAHLAVIWYRLGQRDRADRAMAFLRRQQLSSGGWRQYWGRRTARGESAWVVKHYLDAAWLQVASSFASAASALPNRIDRQDGRFRTVHNWMSTLAAAAKVADVGCGSGRFLRELSTRVPSARLVGIDPSEAFLEQLAPDFERRRGSLLRIPARDGEFDGAFAVESLEHSLLPEQAVQELCRIVRPGGRVLIIDKNVSRQRLSLCEPWERWFTPEMVVDWLKPFCRDVQVRSITHGPNNAAGLFLCWDAIRA